MKIIQSNENQRYDPQNFTVERVNEAISEYYDSEINVQELVFHRKKLENSTQLIVYGIVNDSLAFVLMKSATNLERE